MARGRPLKSEIRQNIVDILYFMKYGYGYDIYKVYMEIFPKVTMRSIYYHLNKGAKTGEFKIHEIKKDKGDYSWGNEVEKVIYCIGANAKPRIDSRIKEYFDKRKK